MNEPTTPTGQLIAEFEDLWAEWSKYILAIESEAKAQERERLRAAIMDWERYDLYFDVLDLLADPEDDR